MKAKFQIQELLGIGLTLVVLGIGIAYGLEVMSDVTDDMATCDTGWTWNKTSNTCYDADDSANDSAISSREANASLDAMSGVAKIPEKLPTIATVVVAAVIIGILVTYLWGRFR